MTPDELAWVLTIYTRAVGKAAGKGIDFSAIVAEELEYEAGDHALEGAPRDAIMVTIETLRRARPAHPAD